MQYTMSYNEDVQRILIFLNTCRTITYSYNLAKIKKKLNAFILEKLIQNLS